MNRSLLTPAAMIDRQLDLAVALASPPVTFEQAMRAQRLLLHWWRLGIIAQERYDTCAAVLGP